jgi:hypothetical protein
MVGLEDSTMTKKERKQIEQEVREALARNGGQRRAQRLTPARRRAIAMEGAQAPWKAGSPSARRHPDEQTLRQGLREVGGT